SGPSPKLPSLTSMAPPASATLKRNSVSKFRPKEVSKRSPAFSSIAWARFPTLVTPSSSNAAGTRCSKWTATALRRCGSSVCPSSPRQRHGRIWLAMLGIDRRAARYVWTGALVLMLLALVYIVRKTLFVFVIAVLLAYLLSPLVNLFDRILPASRTRAPAL